jgi:hypothetical protein
MNAKTLKDVERLAAKAGYLFLATADARGWPHVTVAGRLAVTQEKHLLVTEWFCPGTTANLQVNPKVSLVVWDALTDVGYQLIGELEEIKDLGILDGYSPQVEGKTAVPQVQSQLLIHIDKIIDFRRAPHTDVEE